MEKHIVVSVETEKTFEIIRQSFPFPDLSKCRRLGILFNRTKYVSKSTGKYYA